MIRNLAQFGRQLLTIWKQLGLNQRITVIMAAMAVPDEESAAHLPDVMRELERELSGAGTEFRATGRALPGVVPLLRALHDAPGVLQTLLTGNLAPNAAVKVSAFGLDGTSTWRSGRTPSESCT